MKKSRYTAIVLAAGKGKRMNSDVPKQFLELESRPVLLYSLQAFEKSPVDEIVLVTGADEIVYCKKEIVEKYQLKKVTCVVQGGRERYHSVFCGLKAADAPDYVLIHDGARPFLTGKMIEESMEAVKKYRACVCGMPVKDTIKIADDKGFAKETPDRNKVWMIQTPQTFEYSLLYDAYEKLLQKEKETEMVTDDAMVIEKMTEVKVKLIKGDYNNIKITTPEDMPLAKSILNL